MNNVQNELPEFTAQVLDDSELMLVAGGVMMCTDDTHSICHQDGTNDEDN